ncbi:hypothetical protein M434DRAFT_13442 [Hypoxylon sp. CO27-5]|nr:hypothetical protein M434DRAFT_13442 [Hypoxylon sp. CO27-5]
MSSSPEIPTCDISCSVQAPRSPPDSETQHASPFQSQVLASEMKQQASEAQLKTSKLMMSEVQTEAKQTCDVHSLLQSKEAVSTDRKQGRGLENKDDFAACMSNDTSDCLHLKNSLLEEHERNKQLRLEVDRLKNEATVTRSNVQMLQYELERKQQEVDDILLPQLDMAVLMIREIEHKHRYECEEKKRQVDMLAAQLAVALYMIQNPRGERHEDRSSSQSWI